jgi:hypothetical protein
MFPRPFACKTAAQIAPPICRRIPTIFRYREDISFEQRSGAVLGAGGGLRSRTREGFCVRQDEDT